MTYGPKNPFTKDEETLLVKYLAVYNPTERGRSGANVYKKLCEDPNSKWRWSKGHSWQSWRNQYVKNQNYYDKRIKKYQEKHGIDSNVPYTQKPMNKSPKSEKQRMRDAQAAKRKREEEEEESEGSSEDEDERRKRTKVKYKHEKYQRAGNSDFETDVRSSEPQQDRQQQVTQSSKAPNGSSSLRPQPPQPSSEGSSTESEDEAPRGPVGSDDYEGQIFESDAGVEEEEEAEEAAEEQEVEGDLTEAAFVEQDDDEPLGVHDVPRTSTTPEFEQSEREESLPHPENSIYPDIQQIPSPHLTKSIYDNAYSSSPLPGSFPVSSTPANAAASSSRVMLESTYEALFKKPAPKPSPKLKPKPKSTDDFFESAPGTPQAPTIPDGHRAKQPQLLSGPFRTSFQKQAPLQQQTDSEDEEESRAWPPRRVSGSHPAAQKGKQKEVPKEVTSDPTPKPSHPRPNPRQAATIPGRLNELASKPKATHESESDRGDALLALAQSLFKPNAGEDVVAGANHLKRDGERGRKARGSNFPYAEPQIQEADVVDLPREYGSHQGGPDTPLVNDPTLVALRQLAKGRIPEPSKNEDLGRRFPFKPQPLTASTSTPHMQVHWPKVPKTSEDPFLSRSLNAKQNAPASRSDQPDFALNNPRTATSSPSPSDATMSTGTSTRYIDLRREASRRASRRSRSAPRQSAAQAQTSFETPDHDQTILLYSSEEKSRRHPPPQLPKHESPVASTTEPSDEKALNRRSSLLPFPVPEKDSVRFEFMGASAAIRRIGEKFGLRDDVVERAWHHFRDIDQTEDFCRRYRERTDSVVDQIVDEMERETTSNDVDMDEPIEPVKPRARLAIQDRRRSTTRSLPPSSSPPKVTKDQQLEIRPLPSDDNISEYSAPSSSRAGQYNRLVKQGRREEALRRESLRASGAIPALPELATAVLLGDSPTPRSRLPQPATTAVQEPLQSSSDSPSRDKEVKGTKDDDGQEEESVPRRELTEEEKLAFLYPDRRNAKRLQEIEAHTDTDYLMNWVSSGLAHGVAAND